MDRLRKILPARAEARLVLLVERQRLYRAHLRAWRRAWMNARLPTRALRWLQRTIARYHTMRTYVAALELPQILALKSKDFGRMVEERAEPFVVFIDGLSADAAVRLKKATERAGYRAVAFVTVDRAMKQRIADAVRGAPVFATQDYWIDTQADLRIHSAAHDLLAGFGAAVRPEAHAVLAVLEQAMFGQVVQRSRLGEALAAAARGSPDAVIVVTSLDLAGIQFCGEVLGTLTGKTFHAYEAVDMHWWFAGREVALEVTAEKVLAHARTVLKRWSALPMFNRAAKPGRPDKDPGPARGTGTVAVCSDVSATTPYWAGVEGVLAGAAARGQPAVLVTRSREAADRAREAGFGAQIVAEPAAFAMPAGFLPAYAALADAVAAEVGRFPGERAEDDVEAVSRLVRTSVLLRVLQLDVMYQVIDDLRFVDTMAAKFQQHAVDVVVSLPHWSTVGGLAAAAAAKVGATTSSLPVVSVDGTRASLVGWERIDLIGCYGEQCLEAFRQVGIAGARLRLVGNVALDAPLRLTRDGVLQRNADLRTFLQGAATTILIATSGADPDEIAWFRVLSRAAASLPDARILLRPHPSFGARAYGHFVAEGGGPSRCRIFTETRIHDLIRVSDLVVTDYSTVGAEAVLMGTRLLIVNCTGTGYPANNYDEYGVALLASAPDQIEERIRTLLFDADAGSRLDRNRVEFARRYNWMNDGRAAERYIDALLDYRRRASGTMPEETACPTAPVSASSPARARSSVS